MTDGGKGEYVMVLKGCFFAEERRKACKKEGKDRKAFVASKTTIQKKLEAVAVAVVGVRLLMLSLGIQ